MFNFLKKSFQKRSLAPLFEEVQKINALEESVGKMSDEAILAESEKLKERIRQGESPESALPEAFALVREASKRTLGQRPFDVQLVGGIVIHQGAVAEMMTGEGKTLAAVAPAYLNALGGKGVHVVTVNEYLARRDAVWMGQIYRALGMTVACLVPNGAFLYDPLYKAPEEGDTRATQNPEESKLLDKERDTTGSFLIQQEFLRPVSRGEAYRADIVYGTNHEFGFDYLRDNLAYQLEAQVQRERHFAIIDEVDSILIDEARTPLIIAAPDSESSDAYRTFARVAANLVKEEDFTVDEKKKAVSINDHGVEKVERVTHVKNIYAPENIRLVHYLEESLKAHALFFRDKDYVVKDGEVVIVDEFTGRLLRGRRYQEGLHQAIEAKEGVTVKEESRTYAKISLQNYFRLYEKISGMTGTAQTSAEEFHKVYNLEVVSIPPNRPLARMDMNDVIYKNADAKIAAIVRDVKERSKNGQPVLLGTTSIAKNEVLSEALGAAGVKHEVLNAKNNEREGAIIAQAGKPGAVTVATNVAGRGVDILLGGNPPTEADKKRVHEAGGLHVIGTERHEARRIDNQLRGRAGRQGDPGSTQFFLSPDDDLLRIFGGDRLKGLMDRFDVPEDEPIQFSFVTKAVMQAQEKVEGANFDFRKHLLEYDDVLNKQRSAVYERRQKLLGMFAKEDIAAAVSDAALAHFDAMVRNGATEEDIQKALGDANIPFLGHPEQREGSSLPDEEKMLRSAQHDHSDFILKASEKVAENPMARNQLLGILDMLWMNNLDDLESLSQSVGLRAYGQHDPLVEYRQEASRLFRSFWANYNAWIFGNIFKLLNATAPVQQNQPKIQFAANAQSKSPEFNNVGRNDPCPCGAKYPDGTPKKYKNCGLENTPEHQLLMAQRSNPKHEVTGG
ncbi:MAG: preprotein translocase subunit SecA [Minisyncoccia bacterium]